MYNFIFVYFLRFYQAKEGYEEVAEVLGMVLKSFFQYLHLFTVISLIEHFFAKNIISGIIPGVSSYVFSAFSIGFLVALNYIFFTRVKRVKVIERYKDGNILSLMNHATIIALFLFPFIVISILSVI